MRDKVTFQQFACTYGWLGCLAAGALGWWLAPVHVNAGYVVAVDGLLFSASMLVGTFLRRRARCDLPAGAPPATGVTPEQF